MTHIPITNSGNTPHIPITIPQVSEKQLIIKWVLKSIELQIPEHKEEILPEDIYFSDSENLENSKDFDSTSSSSSSSISGTLLPRRPAASLIYLSPSYALKTALLRAHRDSSLLGTFRRIG